MVPDVAALRPSCDASDMRSTIRFVRRPTADGAPPGQPRLAAAALPTGPAHVIAYGAEDVFEGDLDDIGDLALLTAKFPVVWVDVTGYGDPALLDGIRDALGLHALAVEDVVHLGQRPKLEEYDRSLFCVARMLEPSTTGVQTDQLSVFLTDGVVVTFQERPGDCLDTVRNRIREARGRIRKHGPDYLFYALLDAVVDSYMPIIEDLGDRIEEVEERVLLESTSDVIAEIHEAKVQLLVLRKAVHPLRDALDRILTAEYAAISPETVLYFRDCVDHLHRLADHVESYRDLTQSVMQAHISVVSHRMNDVIGLLTIVSTVFIPLTFLAGVWGMNFDHAASRLNMPELHWAFGYPAALLVMGVIAAAQLWYFGRRGWLRFGR